MLPSALALYLNGSRFGCGHHVCWSSDSSTTYRLTTGALRFVLRPLDNHITMRVSSSQPVRFSTSPFSHHSPGTLELSVTLVRPSFHGFGAPCLLSAPVQFPGRRGVLFCRSERERISAPYGWVRDILSISYSWGESWSFGVIARAPPLGLGKLCRTSWTTQQAILQLL